MSFLEKLVRETGILWKEKGYKFQSRARSVFLLYVMTMFVIAAALCIPGVGYDTNDWDGMDDMNDTRLADKFFNRLYFAMVTCSSIGFGDISPKSRSVKIVTMVCATLIMLGILDIFNRTYVR